MYGGENEQGCMAGSKAALEEEEEEEEGEGEFIQNCAGSKASQSQHTTLHICRRSSNVI